MGDDKLSVNSNNRSTTARSSARKKSDATSRNSSRRKGIESKAAQSKSERSFGVVSEEGYELKSEILALVLITVAIYFFLCNFGICGVIGSALSQVMFGMFGALAYLMPPIISFAAVFYISNEGSTLAVRKILAGLGLVFDIGISFELSTGRTLEPSYDIARIFETAVENKNGGGVIFGSVAYFLRHSISIVGTILLLLVLAAICIVILSQRSLISELKKGGIILGERAREDAIYYKNQALERCSRIEEKRKQLEHQKRMMSQLKEDEVLLRLNRKAHGIGDINLKISDDIDENIEEVSFEKALQISGNDDLFIPDGKSACDDIHEIILNEGEEYLPLKEESNGQEKIMLDGPRIHGYMDDSSDFFDQETRNNDGFKEGSYDNFYEEPNESQDEIIPSKDVNKNEDDYEKMRNVLLDEVKKTNLRGTSCFENTPSDYNGNLSKTDDEEFDDSYLEEEYDIPEISEDIDSDYDDYYDKIQDVDEDMVEITDDFTSKKPVARLAKNDEAEELPDIPIHAGGKTIMKDQGNGFSDEGYAIHSQDHISASSEKQKISSLAKAPSYMPGEISYNNGTKIANNNDTKVVQSPAKSLDERPQPKRPRKYIFPPLNLLKQGDKNANTDSAKDLKETALKLEKTLKTFGVNVTVTDISQGPAVTRYELQPEVGVKVSKIVNLSDDIKLNLAATDIRIEAPIPGKPAVGIEVPNKETVTVTLRELLESKEFKESKAGLSFAVGKDIGGKTIVTDIAKMPHVLIAGATGSGKSVCINTMILSLIYKTSPEDVKMIMIDPKVVELSVYNGIPHLLIPVVTDPKKAAAALNWAVAEMTKRYKLFADAEVRDLKGYNEYVMANASENENLEKLPKIVVIVDELADLMMVSANEVEDAICRLAQLARAAGIHLVIATQRPSVDVITGLIKANMPSRIAFAVSSGTDSRTILDMNGAEKLLGKGDMLFYPQSMSKPIRIQGAFVSDSEIQKITDFVKKNSDDNYDASIQEQMQSIEGGCGSIFGKNNDRDEYFREAGNFIIEKEKASIGTLQRVFKIGFNRAARIMDQLCDAGVVGDGEGTKPRKILMNRQQFDQFCKDQGL